MSPRVGFVRWGGRLPFLNSSRSGPHTVADAGSGSHYEFALSHATSVSKAIPTPSRSSLQSANACSDPSRDNCDVNSLRCGSASNRPTGLDIAINNRHAAASVPPSTARVLTTSLD
ncbi:unnamed protein product [Closterium sp. Naga37s-1]|nr:unnamed protein product [Closterium sp. Naga37s-1]